MKEESINISRWDFGKLAAILALLLGLIGLSGWIFNLFALRSFLSDGATMKVDTALIIISIAGGLLLNHKQRLVSNIFFWISILLCLISLLEHFTKINFGIDQLFFKDLDTNPLKEAPGRTSVLTAIIGLSICLAHIMRLRQKYKTSQLTLAIAFLITYTALMGHLFGARTFYYWGNYSGMAFHTALSFILLQASALISEKEHGYLKVFQSPSSGKIAARALIIYLLLFLPLAASFYLFLIRNDLITITAAVILVIIISTITILPVIYLSLNKVNVIDIDLQKSNADLYAINEEYLASNEELRAANEELSAAREQALIDHNRLKKFFMQAPAGICILSGPELSFELVNPLYQQLFPGRNILGKPMFEAIPEVEGSAIWDVLQNVYRTGKTFEGHELLIPLARTSDGPVEDRYFDFVYQARVNDKQEIDGILVFVIEVTEQVDARQRILETEENLRLAVEAGELGTYSINTRTLVLYTSSRTKELWGFNADDELTFNSIMDQIREDYRTMVAEMTDGAIYRGERFEMEYPIITRNNGKERWIKSVGISVINSTGKDSYFVGTVLDITERRADDQRKNDFIGMVSHELKTPLTTLSAIVQVTNAKLKSSSDTFLSGAMEKANTQVKRMSNMINSFLNVSRLESGKLLIAKQPFDFDELLKEVIKDNELSITTHIIHTNFCDSIYVNADRDKISSVVSNLISNAIKYSPKGQNIYVSCKVNDNEVQVSVRDEGIGIHQEDLNNVFERYFRVQSNAKHISGFGIGLYLSAEIVHHHSGKIWVESEINKGSTFYFSLPLK